MHNPMNQRAGEHLVTQTVPDGQERLATQSERDEVDNRIRRSTRRSDQKAAQLNSSAPHLPGFLACDGGMNLDDQ